MNADARANLPILWLLEKWAVNPGESDLDDLERLIASGADVSARREEGQETPLLMAARLGAVSVCRALLAAGADPNAQRHDGWTPICSAYLEGDVALLDVLLDAGVDPEPEVWSVAHRPVIRNRLAEWKANRAAIHLDAALPGAEVRKSRSRL